MAGIRIERGSMEVMSDSPLSSFDRPVAAEVVGCSCRYGRALDCDVVLPSGLVARQLCYLKRWTFLFAMKAGRHLMEWGLRRLHPECPLRPPLESLAPLVELALSSSSTKRRAAS